MALVRFHLDPVLNGCSNIDRPEVFNGYFAFILPNIYLNRYTFQQLPNSAMAGASEHFGRVRPAIMGKSDQLTDIYWRTMRGQSFSRSRYCQFN